MKIKFILTIILLVFLSTEGNCQFKKKHFKKIPKEFAKEYLITHENVTGKRLSYNAFKNGEFMDASQKEISNFMNTMLLGTATHLFNYLKEESLNFTPIVIEPNGFSSSTFYIKYKFNKGEVFIIRTMDHKKLYFDSMAAEKPENYSLLFAFNFENNDDQKEIEKIITDYALKNNLKIEITKNN